jgi:hypothetical protein
MVLEDFVGLTTEAWRRRVGKFRNLNFEMRIFILGCRDVSRKCKESKGWIFKAAKDCNWYARRFQINSGAPNEALNLPRIMLNLTV